MNNKISIHCGDWSAVIDTEHGANCISLQNEKYGAKLLREPPRSRELDNPYLYGMPILFPVNRIENGKFEFEGRTYVFPINEPGTNCHLHGELHQAQFEVLKHEKCLIQCCYRADSGEYIGFPHAFEISQEYEIKRDGFYHTVTVTNLSEHNMPLFLGFHTTFNTLFAKNSKKENIRVLVDIFEEYERNMEVNYLPTGVKPRFDAVSTSLSNGTYNPFDGKISRHYRGNGHISITDIGNGLRMVYENDEKYGFRLIYSGGSDGYVCLEPQTCLANCQNSPFSREEGGFDFLQPEESKTYRSKIFLEEIQA
ncbi:MAG: aldose 1-epimerase [Clostridia bacterium]|nr:aldose 1-epimerase [Clostridia bacterium]